jgi:phosphonate transport system permease protein
MPVGKIVISTAVIFAWAWWYLGVSIEQAIPNAGGLAKCQEFFGAAMSPAWTYETAPPSNSPAFLTKVGFAVWQTVVFSVAAVSLAFAIGLVWGIAMSSTLWGAHNVPQNARVARYRIAVWFVVHLMRTVSALARSVHELLWAVLFLSAVGLTPLTVILAIGIPYSGVFAKIFSEIIDETPKQSADALHAIGATRWTVLTHGILPYALPDMLAYTCYRFECGLRSAAVMGFFGIPTLGYYLQPAFAEQHYHETWTYLYALMAILIGVELWSAQVRRRLAA